MKQQKMKSESMTFETLLAGCIGIVFLAGVSTWVMSLKEQYAGGTAYSRAQMKTLPDDSLEYQIVKHFYTKEELASITYNADTDQSDAQQASEQTETETSSDSEIEIQKIYGPTYEGYMMLVHNPEDLSVAINPYFSEGGAGPSLDQYVSYYNAVGGINAGGFEDVNGKGDGSLASGIVIHDGKLISGDLDAYWPMICITYTNRLTVMNATGQQMLDWGVRDAVTFQPFLISEGQVVYQSGDGNYPNLSPRSAIGQTDDGTFLLLAIDGRGPSSFGATYEDLISIFQSYGAVTAATLDGGNSTAMMYNGSYVNTPVSMYGSRNLPTVFLIKAEGN